jgi:hypothetical protein
MVREISTANAPSLRRVIERERILTDHSEFVAMRKKEKENSHKKENPLVLMTIIALKRACDELGVKYWE